jgi:hypothetical protein
MTLLNQAIESHTVIHEWSTVVLQLRAVMVRDLCLNDCTDKTVSVQCELVTNLGH